MLVFSALCGTLAALLWSIGDLLAKLYLPRFGGGIRWVLWGQVFGLMVFFLVFWATGYRPPPLSGDTLFWLGALGLVGLGGYLFFFTAIEQGHLSIVAPISASWVGISFILSAAFLPQVLPLSSWGMLVLILVGVILTAVPKDTGENAPKRSLAVLMAIGSSLCWGSFNFFVKFLAEHSDPYLPIVMIKAWGALFSIVLVAMGRYHLPFLRQGPKRGLFALPLAAVLDIVAYLGYTRGALKGIVPITAAFAGLFSLFAVLLGVLVLKEKLARGQIAGILLIVTASIGLFYLSP